MYLLLSDARIYHFPGITLNQQPLSRHRPFEIGGDGEARLMAVRGTILFLEPSFMTESATANRT